MKEGDQAILLIDIAGVQAGTIGTVVQVYYNHDRTISGYMVRFSATFSLTLFAEKFAPLITHL